MLNEVKHLYHEDPSLALKMTGNKYSDTMAICQISVIFCKFGSDVHLN